MSDDYVECDTCRTKPGAATLCSGCLSNRTLISKLQRRVRELERLVDYKQATICALLDLRKFERPHWEK